MTDEQATPSEGAEEAETAETSEYEQAESEAENEPQDAPEMRVEDALLFSIGMFADMAWIHLGIRARPGGGETKTDFPQAHLSIDAVKALVQLVEGHLEAHQMRDLQNLLSSLQLNYAQRYQPGK